MKPSGISPLLLEKYLSGQCTDEEKQLVEKWYAALEGERNYLDLLPEEAQAGIRQHTFVKIRAELGLPRKRSVGPVFRRWFSGIAASILVLLAVYLVKEHTSSPPPMVTEQVSERSSPEHPDRIAFTNNLERMVIHRLPDNSSILMHPRAKVSYPTRFAADRRAVTFSGEGFFDIQKDKSRPFYIRSGEMEIRVLGTSFNVKAAEHRKVFQVDVVTGSVEVSAYAQTALPQQVILKPKQRAVLELDTKRLISSTILPRLRKEIYEPVTIVFEETPLNRVVEQLEKRFNATITLSNPGLAQCRLTANFESQTFTTILEMLCASLDVTYTISENTVAISGEACE